MSCTITCWENTNPYGWGDGVDPNGPLHFVDGSGNVITELTYGGTYDFHIPLHNGAAWWENYRLEYYADGSPDCFYCVHSSAGAFATFDLVSPIQMTLELGSHYITVKNIEKGLQSTVYFNVVTFAEYDWFLPDPYKTASYFILTPASSACTNPVGTSGQIICGIAGTSAPLTNHRYQCNGTSWVDLGVCQYGCSNNDCNSSPPTCTDPPGPTNQIICGIAGTSAPLTNHRYQCNGTSWENLGECETGYVCINGVCKDAGSECACPTYNSTQCVDAIDSNGKRCCWWYKRLIWENERCWPEPKTLESQLMAYLPYIALGTGGIILGAALLRKPVPQYYYSEPPPQQTTTRPRKRTTRRKKK